MYIFPKIIHTTSQKYKEVNGMDEARKKVRVCLLCVVAAAVIIGLVYYFRDVRGSGQVTDGTLVWQTESNVKPATNGTMKDAGQAVARNENVNQLEISGESRV